ncbi:putative Single-strand telomeric DNA-binding protein GBP2 (putative) [Pseudozyma hubeiensis]|nr:putative Single-strand telomeric DNA-binding protein GBP2 (putative) [Pseudozyma hubeiensis]
MSANPFNKSFDGASGAAPRPVTSPFSPHAAAFGPKSTRTIDSSAAASTKSTSDKSSPTQPTGSDSPPSSAGPHSFTDRMHYSSDRLSQSNSDAISNFSATSSRGAATASRQAQSPLASAATDPFVPSHASHLNAQSPLSLATPKTSEQQQQQQQRHLSSSFASHNASPSLFLDGGAESGARPTFGRQSFSDGPSSSAALLLSADATSSSVNARSGSFSGSFPPVDPSSPLPQHAAAPTVGLSDPQSGINTPPAPTTGPLSASDPRTQLLVSNLPYRVRWQDLKDLFRKAGTVLRADVSLSADNRSRGYGTVLMATEQDAIKAADLLGGFTWQGRTLDVRVDRSGALLGVAGSAVMPTITPNPASSPNLFASAPPATSPSAFSLDPNPGAQQFLGIPTGSFNSGNGSSPASFSGAASPSLPSSGIRSADHPQRMPTRASFSAHADAPFAGGEHQPSEFERAMLQGQGPSVSSGNATPNRHRPGSNFDASYGSQPQHRAVSAVQSLASHPMSSRRGSEAGSAVANNSPSPSPWTSSVNDAAASMYAQSAGGSSVPTGFPGAPAMAPWPAGPGSFGGQGMASMQSQPFGSQMPTTSYAGRVLFVGNLPFHCQWQDLKDLFRAAGSIQRADVAIGPDGRSRGFGTVLFSSQEDAQNAVRLYHGYEYSGRTLKVHFDRFATQNGPAVGTPGNPAQYTGAFAAAALPSHMTNNVRAPLIVPQAQQQVMQSAFGQAQYSQPGLPPHQQRASASVPFGIAQQGQGSYGYGQTAFQPQNTPNPNAQFNPLFQPSQQIQHQQRQQQQRYAQQPHHSTSGFTAFGNVGAPSHQTFSTFSSLADLRKDDQMSGGADGDGTSARPLGTHSDIDGFHAKTSAASERDDDHGMSITMPANDFGAASSYLPSDLMSPGLVSPPAPTQQGQQNASHPGRIQLPSTNFANSFGAAMGGQPAGQTSDMTARMQVPMTPGMPGFTFQQVPQTPPLYPQFLSPGLDAFSPTVGSADAASHTAGAHSGGGDHSNAAPGVSYNVPVPLTPGAPLGYNPVLPAYGGQRGPHQQQQPATPHWSQTPGPRRAGGGNGAALRQAMGAHDPEADEVVDAANRLGIAKTPGAGPRRPSHADVGGHKPTSRRASVATPGAVEPSLDDGYPFPVVTAGNMQHLTRRASMDSPAQTPLASGPTGSHSSNSKPDSAPIPAAADEVLAGTSAEELANTIARLSVKGTALARESNTRRSLSMTAERSAAASAMAKLQQKTGTPTPPGQDAADGEGATVGLGAPFGEPAQPPRLGLAGRVTSAGATHTPSPLATSQLEPSKAVFGMNMTTSAMEAARNGSALDTEDAAGSR